MVSRPLRTPSPGPITWALPANLTPSLKDATAARPLIINNSCSLWFGQVKSKPCVYGDTKASTSVALFGDSHAAAWFPALNMISKRSHWRLLIFTKAGCTPPVGVPRKGKDFPDCVIWRQNTMHQIAALHPALVVVSWARWIAGDAVSADAWVKGVAKSFAFLHRSANHVIFISDVPTFVDAAATFLSSHISDVRPCNNAPPSSVIVLPTIKNQELQEAASEHIGAIDPIPWFCSPTACPVVVGHILLYRDNSHMTPAWSRFIAPVPRAQSRRSWVPNRYRVSHDALIGSSTSAGGSQSSSGERQQAVSAPTFGWNL